MPWKNLPQNEDLKFSKRYAEHHEKKLKKIATRPLFSFIPEVKQTPLQNIDPQTLSLQEKDLLITKDEVLAPADLLKDKDFKQIPVQRNLENKIKNNLPTSAPPLQIQELERLMTIEQGKESPKPIPLFIYEYEESIQGACDSLKIKFPSALFVSEKELQKLLDQKQTTPFVAYYLQRFDDFFIKPNEQLLNNLSKYENISLAFVGLSRVVDKNKLEDGIKKFNQHLKNSPIPSIQQTKCLTMTFETAIVNDNFYPKLTKSEENAFFKNIQQVLDEAQIKNSSIHALTPIQAQPTSSLQPVFIYRHEGDLKSIYSLLKNKYSRGIFATIDQFQNVLEQNKDKPLVVFFLNSLSNRIDDIPSLISPLKPITNYSNANLVYICLSLKNDQNVMKGGMKKLENLLQQTNSVNLKNAKCISIGYEIKHSYEAGIHKSVEKLTSQDEENFLKEINQFLKKDQK